MAYRAICIGHTIIIHAVFFKKSGVWVTEELAVPLRSLTLSSPVRDFQPRMPSGGVHGQGAAIYGQRQNVKCFPSVCAWPLFRLSCLSDS